MSTAPRLLAYLLANMASDFENILSSTKLTRELYTGKGRFSVYIRGQANTPQTQNILSC